MAKKYHWSSYWDMWSRRLESDGIHHIDLNLSPIAGRWNSQREWDEEVGEVVLRDHCTADHGYDRNTDELPQEVISKMIYFLGEEKVKMLLAGDIMGLVDRAKLKAHPSGGAPLIAIQKRG